MRFSFLLLILASFVGGAAAQSNIDMTGYHDISPSHTNATAIGYMKITNAMTGYDGGEFRPEGYINRAEMVKVLSQVYGQMDALQDCTDTAFTDVPEGEWFLPYVCLATTHGWVRGYGDATFRPANYVTMAEAIKLVAVSMGMEPTEDTPWYRPYAVFLAERWIVPNDAPVLGAPVPRRIVAEMLWRANIWNTKYAQVENPQAEPAFFAALSLELDEILADSRPKAFVPESEPVAHMEIGDPYFAERIAESDVQNMLRLINQERDFVAGAPEVELNTRLSRVAQMHADRMVKYDFFAHVTPAGETVRMRVLGSGYKAVYFGENLARAAYTPLDAMEKWRHSPKHYANLLDDVFTHVGIGWAPDEGQGGFFYVLIFAQEFPMSPDAVRRPNTEPSPAEGKDTVDYFEYPLYGGSQ